MNREPRLHRIDPDGVYLLTFFGDDEGPWAEAVLKKWHAATTARLIIMSNVHIGGSNE